MSYRGSGLRKRPSCFGRADVYDLRKAKCRVCFSKRTCKVVVAMRNSNDNDNDNDDDDDDDDNRRTPVSLKTPNPADYTERSGCENVPYMHAVALNAALSAVRGMFAEVIYALDQVPRFPYNDPFSDWFKPPDDG